MSRQKPEFKAKLKIKKGDTVKVIAGASRGVTGEVLEVLPKANRAIVEGANIRIKHQKPTEADAGGRVEKAMPIHISNLALIDPKSGETTRVGRREEGGKLVRYAKKSGQILS
jgi:large subunit ribosomal protein L24